MTDVMTPYATLDVQFNVSTRLQQLQLWQQDYQEKLTALEKRMADQRQLYLTAQTQAAKQRAVQQTSNLAIYRKRFQLLQVKQPLTMKATQHDEYQMLVENLAVQYAALTQAEKLLWLNNLIFLVTPDVKQLCAKLDSLQHFQSVGQERNLLVSGVSGSGKSSALHWYALCHLPLKQEQLTHLPVVMVEPLEDDKSRKSLLEQIIASCGGMQVARFSRPIELLTQVNACFAWCGTRLLIVDELNHLATNQQRRQLLSITNQCGGVSIVGSAVYPRPFRETDDELAGRFLDEYPMQTYTGKQLAGLLAFIELLLPFTEYAGLSQHWLTPIEAQGKPVTGLAQFIEDKTQGRLREIMLLIRLASEQAIRLNLAGLNMQLLQTTWDSIQRMNPDVR